MIFLGLVLVICQTVALATAACTDCQNEILEKVKMLETLAGSGKTTMDGAVMTKCGDCQSQILEKLGAIGVRINQLTNPEFPKSCAEVTDKTKTKHRIDPDGAAGKVDPFVVECDFSTTPATTIIHHDKEARTYSGNCQTRPRGCKNVKLNYRASMYQITKLMATSSKCSQFMRWECRHSVIWSYVKEKTSNIYTYWKSRQGTRMNYWAGGPKMGKGCACGITKTCADVTKLCNCDINDGVRREDYGTITDMTKLPASEVSFGDIEHPGVNGENGYYTIGPLRCQ